MRRLHWISLLAALAAGCGDNARLLDAGPDLGTPGDLGVEDTGAVVDRPATEAGVDAGVNDAGLVDAGVVDAGVDVRDVTTDEGADAGPADTGVDVPSPFDAGGDVPVATDAGADVPMTDAGATDASADATDASATDAGTADAAPTDVPVDVPTTRGTPTIDGAIGADWPPGALLASNATASAWGPTLNYLRSLRVAWNATHLYLGVEGSVEAVNAMVVYIDRDYLPGSTATGVTRIASLTDGAGALDDAVSCGVTDMPAGLGVDFAWGTRGMLSKTATELRAEIGLRELSCTGCAGDFRWVMGDTAVCSASGASPACEVAIPWTALYGGAPPPVPRLGVFVRLTNAMGTDLSNQQTLPEQSPPAPTAVTRVLAFSPDL